MTLHKNLVVKHKIPGATFAQLNMTKQRGVVLFIALIALVVMSLAAVALIRSVDTNTMIAGNLAFKQAATASADTGVEDAIAWLQSNNNGSGLDSAVSAVGYSASTTNAAADPTGSAYWAALTPSGFCTLPRNGNICSAAGVPDAAGNIAAFMIQRLCRATGSSTSALCMASTTSSSTAGNNEGAGEEQLEFSTAVFYRITVRVTGPRNTESYVQTIVSM